MTTDADWVLWERALMPVRERVGYVLAFLLATAVIVAGIYFQTRDHAPVDQSKLDCTGSLSGQSSACFR